MVTSETVTVYNFHTFESGIELPRVAPFKATRQAIERVHQGRVIEGTEEHVEADELDEQGRYRRRATGWGELD